MTWKKILNDNPLDIYRGKDLYQPLRPLLGMYHINQSLSMYHINQSLSMILFQFKIASSSRLNLPLKKISCPHSDFSILGRSDLKTINIINTLDWCIESRWNGQWRDSEERYRFWNGARRVNKKRGTWSGMGEKLAGGKNREREEQL